ncbi:MAG TPA: glycosyltransferase family A protein [Bacteroidales bacterium]|nr:glycosyltransferase family A protein [Bacteroidales bacterium]HQI70385.1 glycosyltransferase family A protein [Bacteroidales bacterium]
MKLSILLTSFNHQKYLKESLDSIFMQDMPLSYEIIVADDHSTDNSLAIIESRLKNEFCSYQILPSIENLGISKNYQRALSACSGEYIAVLEADDYWTEKQRLKKHIAFLDAHPEYVMSYNRIIYYFEDKKDFYESQWKNSTEFEFMSTSMLAKGNNIVNLSACVLRNAAVKKLPRELFDLKIADWMLGMAMGMQGPLARLKDPMSVYRISGSGEWSAMSQHQKNCKTIALIDTYNKFFNYKFDKEFTEHKHRLLAEEKNDDTSKPTTAVTWPAWLAKLIRRILPLKVRNYIQKKITRE